jgi:DNA-binding response OmpR family regulator
MRKKILIVDDEAPIRRVLEKALGKAGFEVLTAGDGTEGLELARGERVPVMFLDLMLPGIEGTELCRRIREDNPIACIFAMTGHTSLFELAACREAGFDDYFTKPFKLEEIIEAAGAAFARLERWKR